MTDKLALWDAVKRPPTEALKSFTRGGGFKGTAIKPMWSIKVMTEHYGPCGEGWGINEPTFTTISANNELLVYCTVSLWHGKRENIVFGVGGDKVLVVQSNGPRTDDEAFKKAFTDAITNALKHIGVGADIHMGLWDGSKYAADEGDEPTTKPMSAMGAVHQNTKGNSMTAKDALCKEIADINSLRSLMDWGNNADNIERLNSLHPDHLDTVQNSYSERAKELKAKGAV